MEKLIVYSYRIDAYHNLQTEEKLRTWISQHDDCKYYVFAREFKQDKTPHFQGLVFLEKKIQTAQERMSYTNVKTKTWVLTHRNSVSFVRAKNVASMKKYVNDKEGHGLVTNIPQSELDKFGKWLTKDELCKNRNSTRKENDSKFKALLLKSLKNQEVYSLLNYYQIFANIAYDVYEKPIPMRSLILLSKSLISKDIFLRLLYRELN